VRAGSGSGNLQPRTARACRRARSCQAAARKRRSAPLWRSGGRALTASARAGVQNPRSGRKKACGAVEPKKARNKQAESKRLRLWGGDTEECSRRGWEREPGNQIFKAFTCGVCSGMFAEQVELPRGGAAFWRGGVFERSGSPRIARRVPSARPRCKRRLHRKRRIRAIWLGACASSWSFELGVNLVLHAEARAFDDDRLGVVQDAIEDGGGQRAVVVEDL
jgi:hypothetical protein